MRWIPTTKHHSAIKGVNSEDALENITLSEGSCTQMAACGVIPFM
jgi:hypothetical protein